MRTVNFVFGMLNVWASASFLMMPLWRPESSNLLKLLYSVISLTLFVIGMLVIDKYAKDVVEDG